MANDSVRDDRADDPKTLAINNTSWNRLETRLALATVGKLYKSNGVCTPISNRKIVKASDSHGLTEAATMKFVAANTSVPVPKVYCSFVRKGCTYIVMERIQGDVLPKPWKTLSEDGKRKVFAQLQSIVDELRALAPPPNTGVESCVGGVLHNPRLPGKSPFGPFKTIQEYHHWLREGFEPSLPPGRERDSEWKDLEKMVCMQDGSWPPPVFTHGDLNPFNIMMRGNEIVAIIDWEW